MIIEKNNHNIPDYLDEKFIRNALISRTNSEDVEIKSIDFSMGSSGGENYLSFIYRVKIIYTQKDTTPREAYFIIKSIPLDGAREIFVEMNIFDKEKEMYFDIIPRIEDYLDNVKLAPLCYYTTTKPTATIVFEDLKVSGHNLADRVKGLDEDHSKVILRKLGQYHAGSMVLLEEDPSLRQRESLHQGLFSSVGISSDKLQKPCVKNMTKLIGHVKKWPGYEKIAEKLENLVGTKFADNVVQAVRIGSDDIVTICHGDMWVNNFFFKYEDSDDSPTDAILIDFQASMLGSIGLDINYLLPSSLKIDVFLNKRVELIEDAYYPAFKGALEKMAYKNIPTLQQVKAEVQKKVYFGFMSSLIVLPMISMNKEESAENSVETLANEENAERIIDIACSSKRFLDTMRHLLKEYDRCGILDQ